MIERILKDRINNGLNTGKAIIILGARQVGKTTLLESIFKEYDNVIILNGDEPDNREMLSEVSSKQLALLFGNAKYVIIDEAQMIPDVGITLKLITDRLKNINLIVSGSSSLDLANKINEPLTGRKLEYRMFPLSFSEMSTHHGVLEEKRMLFHRLIYGYYPDIVTTQGQEKRLLKNLAGSYLYKDILSFGNIQRPVVLDKLLKALALQVGSEVSFNELSKTVGADKETVERYINLLEKAFIIFKLDAFSRNVRNELKKSKKIYFYDNGIRNAVIGNFQNFDLRIDKGALWENFIISERIKYLNYNEFYGSYYFWRTTQQQEIDFIEEIDGKIYAYEFKLNTKKRVKFPKTFLNNYQVHETLVVTPGNIESFIL